MTITIEREGLQSKSKADLETIAKQIGVRVTSAMRKGDIVDAIIQHHGSDSPAVPPARAAAPNAVVNAGDGAGGARERTPG